MANPKVAEALTAARSKISNQSDLLDQALSLVAGKYGDGAAKPKIEFSQMIDAVSRYINDEKPSDESEEAESYTVDDYLETLDGARGDLPNGVEITLAANGSLLLCDAEAGKMTESVTAGSKTIFNLTPGAMSHYVNHVSGAISQTGFIKPTGQVRFIKATTTYNNAFAGNIRDIGGWACDGGTLSYNKIFRGGRFNGDGWAYASEEDQNTFVNLLRVRDEIDLRYENAARTRSAFGDQVDYVRYAINSAYSGGIRDEITKYSAALHRIIFDLQNGRTLYVHCMAGADRTGTICAIIEALCGVSEDDIDKDYELTSFVNVTGVPKKYKTNASWIAFKNALRGSHTGSSALRDGAVDWALSAGFTYSEINSLRDLLIDGTPDQIIPPVSSFTVQNVLSNVTTSNPAEQVSAGEAYTATLTAAEGYAISSASVTMGGADITSSAYSNGVINISSVTGDVVITASAAAVTLPNILTESFSTHGETYPAIGYLANTRLKTSGSTAACEGWYTTGFIPVMQNDVIRFKGLALIEASSGDNKTMINFYSTNDESGFIVNKALRLDEDGSDNTLTGFYQASKTTSGSDTVYSIKNLHSTAAFIRISAQISGTEADMTMNIV